MKSDSEPKKDVELEFEWDPPNDAVRIGVEVHERNRSRGFAARAAAHVRCRMVGAGCVRRGRPAFRCLMGPAATNVDRRSAASRPGE
ncbi:hypothetical protein [Burkholderia pyrrocinia]|uniref:hypothetical protein n=1 Tax=Burkholderia pyrrocinia TaxID=60550 RepID=UPI001FC7C40C|nr:hypothetical protein [Burkholderia pyrrocinia]